MSKVYKMQMEGAAGSRSAPLTLNGGLELDLLDEE
jgi:hypothetical protein